MTNRINDAPDREPNVLVAGDTWTWKRSDLGSDYPTSAWVLSYAARKCGAGATSIAIEASPSGSDYVITVPAATTAGFDAGQYDWAAYLTRESDSARVQIGDGRWTIKPNLATSTADPRTHAEKVLAAIESVLENRATKDVESYTIEGRSLTRMKVSELLVLRDRYKAEVNVERRAARGQSSRDITLISFN